MLFTSTLCKASTVTPNYIAYCATKGAIEQMTRVMPKDLARKGIMVNCAAPGPTATDFVLSGKPQNVIDMFARAIPQTQLGNPEEVAGTVRFLSGPESRWGQQLNLLC